MDGRLAEYRVVHDEDRGGTAAGLARGAVPELADAAAAAAAVNEVGVALVEQQPAAARRHQVPRSPTYATPTTRCNSAHNNILLVKT